VGDGRQTVTDPAPARAGQTVVEAVIFDCDGVLVDSEAIYIDAELEYLAGAGVRFERAGYVQAFMGLSPVEWRRRLSAEMLARTGRVPAAGFFTTLDAFVMEAFETRLTALPGAREAVAGLDMVRCVASSTPLERLTWKLRRTGLLDLFAPHLFSAEMVPRGKPAPDLFLHAATTLGVDPRRCVVVEDSVNGVRAARAAGMRAVGFTAGSHCLDGHDATLVAGGADVVIDAFADLRATLDRLSRP
jgi:HAD superfamily hydrolase (TIGR01509 family)